MTYRSQAMPIEIAPGVFIAVPGSALFEGVDLEGGMFDVKLELDMTREGIRAVAVTVASQDGATPVALTTLRAVKVWELTQRAIASAVERGYAEGSPDGPYDVTTTSWGQLSDQDAARLRAQGPTDEALGWVAFHHNLAAVLGLPPAKQVEVNLGLPRSTASKWVRRAREKGLLTRTSQ